MIKIVIIGNLTYPPKMGETNGQKIFCNFDVAATTGFGESKSVEYFRVKTFGQRAETCGKFLDKGSKVCVTGDLKTRSYDKKDASLGWSMEIMANEIVFLSPKQETPETPKEEKSLKDQLTEIKDEDLPF